MKSALQTSALDQKLFMVYLGGRVEGALVEVHDIRFVLGCSIEDTFEDLRQQWWGEQSGLHLDCWGAIEYADGYAVTLQSSPQESDNKLFFINLGGYDPKQFTELHENILVVAPTESKAKVKALKSILHLKGAHKDNMYEVENIYSLDNVAADKSLYIHLEKTEKKQPFEFICKYKRIDKIVRAEAAS
ncbi:MAG: DUF1543 domain-containing protein [Alphaproteobacteria bacterium]